MTGWDRDAAEWYAENYGEYATNRLAIDALELTPAHVVDVGCGTGAALRHASERWPECRFTGVDPVPRMVEIAKERLAPLEHRDRIEILEGSAEALPVADASADLVLAFDTYDHWQDVQRGAREVARVLQPDGTLVVVKDLGVPQDAAAQQAMLSTLRDEAGLTVSREARVDEDDVSFHMWVLGRAR